MVLEKTARRNFIKRWIAKPVIAAAIAASTIEDVIGSPKPKNYFLDRIIISASRKAPDGTITGSRQYKSGKHESYVIKPDGTEIGETFIPENNTGLHRAESYIKSPDGNVFRYPGGLNIGSDGSISLDSLIRSFAGILKDYPHAEKYTSIVPEYAMKNSLDPVLVMGVIRQESNFGKAIVSDIGAAGDMQIIPPTAKFLGMQNIIYPENYDRMLSGYMKAVRSGDGASARTFLNELLSYSRFIKGLHAKHGENMKQLDERFDTKENIGKGCKYLAMLRDATGSINLALAAYLAGPANIRERMTKSVKGYVDSILGFYNRYKVA